MNFPQLCGLNILGQKAPMTSAKVAAPKVATPKSNRQFPDERQLMRQQVNLRSLKTIIRQAVEEVEGAETLKRSFND